MAHQRARPVWRYLVAGSRSSCQLPRPWLPSVRVPCGSICSQVRRAPANYRAPGHPACASRVEVFARRCAELLPTTALLVIQRARPVWKYLLAGAQSSCQLPRSWSSSVLPVIQLLVPTPARWCGARSGVGRGWLWCGRCDPSALVWREEWGRAAGGCGVAVANPGHHLWLLEINILGGLGPTCLTSAMFGYGPRGEGTCERSSRLPPEAPEGLFELSTEASAKGSKAAGSRPLAG